MTGFPLDPDERARIRAGWADHLRARVESDINVLGCLPACRNGDHDSCGDDGTGCLCDHHLGGDS